MKVMRRPQANNADSGDALHEATSDTTVDQNVFIDSYLIRCCAHLKREVTTAAPAIAREAKGKGGRVSL